MTIKYQMSYSHNILYGLPDQSVRHPTRCRHSVFFLCVFRLMEFLEFLESKRGGRMVVCKHFKFNFGSTCNKDGLTRSRCVTRTCDAKFNTDRNNAFSSAVGEHYHINTLNRILIVK